MAISPEQKVRLSRYAGKVSARLIELVHRTSKIVREPDDPAAEMLKHHPAIIAVWHGQFMMLAPERPRSVPYAAMVARHGDAEVIGEAMSKLGVELIRGAGAGARKKDRGGAHALRAALNALAAGKSIVMTADVPPGPARIAGAGILTIARLSGRPILPVAVASKRYKALDTWSRMTIALPYSTLGYVVGQPIQVSRDLNEEGIEAKRREVEQGLNRVTARAYALAGADPTRATPPGRADPNAPAAEPGLGLKVYRSATSLLAPAAPMLLKYRERNGKEDPARRAERLGFASAERPAGPLVWVHAASVGETNAILPFVERLGDLRPDLSFLLTTGTVTSATIASRRMGARVTHQYVPIDSPAAVDRFLGHWQPDLAVFTESEIWPNLVMATAARGIPLTLVNARMSNSSYGRWKRRPGMAQPIFNRFGLVVAQNEKLARRFGDLGARNVTFAANIKNDAPPPPVDTAAKDKLAAAIAGRAVFAAASTHDGEDGIIADAHRRLARDLSGLLTIVAPRHPERGTAIAERLQGLGLRTAQRSLGALPTQSTDVYVFDTIGELGLLYSLAPVAFIGGSLVEKGGQNPIEAIRLGAGVLTGPHWLNFRDGYTTLLRHKGAIEVTGSADLAAAVQRLLSDPAELARLKEGAESALQTLGGGLAQTIKAVEPFLPSRTESLRRAS